MLFNFSKFNHNLLNITRSKASFPMLWGNCYPHGAYSLLPGGNVERNTSSTGQSERSAMKNVVPKCWQLCGRAIHSNWQDLGRLLIKRWHSSLKGGIEFEAKDCSVGILGQENNVSKDEKRWKHVYIYRKQKAVPSAWSKGLMDWCGESKTEKAVWKQILKGLWIMLWSWVSFSRQWEASEHFGGGEEFYLTHVLAGIITCKELGGWEILGKENRYNNQKFQVIRNIICQALIG